MMLRDNLRFRRREELTNIPERNSQIGGIWRRLLIPATAQMEAFHWPKFTNVCFPLAKLKTGGICMRRKRGERREGRKRRKMKKRSKKILFMVRKEGEEGEE